MQLLRVVLLEVGGVLFREGGLVGGQFVERKDRIRGAYGDAASAIDALVGVDEQLGNGVCAFLIAHGMNCIGGTLWRTEEVLYACIGDNVGHNLLAFKFWAD